MAHSFVSSAVVIKRQFCRLLTAQVILGAAQESAHVFRKRKFDPVLTIHLFVLQVLHGNTAIVHLRHLAGASVNAAAYCRARMRLPVQLYEKLLDYSASLLCRPGSSLLFGVRRVLLTDASSSLLPDTPSIRKLFDQPRNVKPGCGYPMAKVLALFDAASGAVLRPLICTLFVHESSRVWKLHPLLRAGDLLVGDRAFCSYAHLAMLSARKVWALFRMQQRQKVDFRRGRKHGGKGRPTSRYVRRLGRYDQLVEWFKPQIKPKWMSKAQDDDEDEPDQMQDRGGGQEGTADAPDHLQSRPPRHARCREAAEARSTPHQLHRRLALAGQCPAGRGTDRAGGDPPASRPPRTKSQKVPEIPLSLDDHPATHHAQKTILICGQG
jgi:hypothetical protein